MNDKDFMRFAYKFDPLKMMLNLPYQITDANGKATFMLLVRFDNNYDTALFRDSNGDIQRITADNVIVEHRYTITGPLICCADNEVTHDHNKTTYEDAGKFGPYYGGIMECNAVMDNGATIKNDTKESTGLKQSSLDEINGYPHSWIEVSSDCSSDFVINPHPTYHTPTTEEKEDLMRHDATTEEDYNYDED